MEKENEYKLKKVIIPILNVFPGDDGLYYIRKWNRKEGRYEETHLNTTGFATREAAEDWANENNLCLESHIEDVYVDAAK